MKKTRQFFTLAEILINNYCESGNGYIAHKHITNQALNAITKVGEGRIYWGEAELVERGG